MSRTVTLAGFALLGAVALGLQVAALVWRRAPTLGEAVAVASRRPWARALLVAGWLWVGWHVFVRADWR